MIPQHSLDIATEGFHRSSSCLSLKAALVFSSGSDLEICPSDALVSVTSSLPSFLLPGIYFFIFQWDEDELREDVTRQSQCRFLGDTSQRTVTKAQP